MATNNRGRSRGGSTRAAENNNPKGRNQYSGVMNTARDNPLAAVAVAGGALAAGVFLWSRRNQIGDQIGELAGQISEWREGMAVGGDSAAENTSSGNSLATTTGSRRRRSQAEVSQDALTLKEVGKTS